MDPVSNAYAPGAEIPPPELCTLALHRVKSGRPANGGGHFRYLLGRTMMQDHAKAFDAFRRAWLPNLSSYINAPIKDKGTLSSLQKRAASFEFQGMSLPSALIPGLTFDIGSLILNKQLFVSAIDLESSKELLQFASRKFGYDATPENTGAGLLIERSFEAAISRQFGKPAHSHFEAIILVRTDEDRIVWPSRNGRRHRVFGSYFAGNQIRFQACSAIRRDDTARHHDAAWAERSARRLERKAMGSR
jgi:hypothetical protein